MSIILVVCVVCGKQFDTTRHGISCSKECKEIRKRKKNLEYYYNVTKPFNEGYKSQIRNCLVCKKEFLYSGKEKFCSDECRKIHFNNYHKEYERRLRKRKGDKIVI